MKKLIALLIIGCLMVGCQKSDPEPTPTPAPTEEPAQAADAGPVADAAENENYARPDGFAYVQGGVTITMGVPADPVIQALGEPRNVFEEPSCAFDGIDRTYYYQDFYVNTFPDGGIDYVMSVNFLSDAVQTPEGLYVGMSEEKMREIYGEDFTQEKGMFTYEKNGTELAVLTEDGEVIQITYYWVER